MNKISVALTGLLTLSATSLGATLRFNYTNQPPDVLLAFRQVGSSPSEIVAVIGPITRFSQAAPGSSFQITEVSTNQLGRIFSGLDKLRFAVFASQAVASATNPPFRTLWVTAARRQQDVPATPWFIKSTTSQGTTTTAIRSIGDNAVTYSLLKPDGPDNNGTLVVLPSNSNNSYSIGLGPLNNFRNTFQGSPEAILPQDFASDPTAVMRADFYQMVVGTPAATQLGYFEFRADSTLYFVAAAPSLPPAPAPDQLTILRSGTSNTVTFSTVSGGYVYQLLRSPGSNPAAPLAQWTPLGSGVTGTGSLLSLSDVSDDDAAFYRVQVNP